MTQVVAVVKLVVMSWMCFENRANKLADRWDVDVRERTRLRILPTVDEIYWLKNKPSFLSCPAAWAGFGWAVVLCGVSNTVSRVTPQVPQW